MGHTGGESTITRRLGGFRAIVLCAIDTLTSQFDPAGEFRLTAKTNQSGPFYKLVGGCGLSIQPSL